MRYASGMAVSGKLIAFVAYAAVFAIVAQQVWKFWLGRQARTWPSVTGRVTEARIVRGRLPADPDEPLHRKGDEYFAIEVRYDYVVRGKAYVGTRFSFGLDHFPDYDAAIDALHGIAAGREVQVYYDPRKPQRAALRWSG
jgi:hypothetical protein